MEVLCNKKEGSIFNPEHTDNQLTYFEYAKESGWEFVCEIGQMQIFRSSMENPVPFETGDLEMLENIHTCMKKSFLPSQIILLLLWTLNLGIRIHSFINRPADFLADELELMTFTLFLMSAIFSVYTLISYGSWYKESKRSIELGGGIRNSRSKVKKIYEKCHIILLFSLVFSLVFYMFAVLWNGTHLGIIALAIGQVPIFILVFWGAVHIQKRLSIPANINKIVTFSVYILTVIFYCSFMAFIVIKFI